MKSKVTCETPDCRSVVELKPPEVPMDISLKWVRTYMIHLPDANVRQARSKDCWAAALAQMLSYRDSKCYSDEDAARMLGDRGVGLYKADNGLSGDAAVSLLGRIGLVPVEIDNPSPSDWFRMLKEYGPLFVGVIHPLTKTHGDLTYTRDYGHAIVVIGVVDTGSPASSIVHFKDVAVAAAAQSSPYEQFMVQYGKCFKAWGVNVWHFEGMENQAAPRPRAAGTRP